MLARLPALFRELASKRLFLPGMGAKQGDPDDRHRSSSVRLAPAPTAAGEPTRPARRVGRGLKSA